MVNNRVDNRVFFSITDPQAGFRWRQGYNTTEKDTTTDSLVAFGMWTQIVELGLVIEHL
jgi:hypothetical protein